MNAWLHGFCIGLCFWVIVVNGVFLAAAFNLI